MSRTIFEALRNDHDSQRALFSELLERPCDAQERRELFDSLRHEMRAHVLAEERALYARLLRSSTMQSMVGHAIREHQDFASELADLERARDLDSGWLRKLRSLCHCALVHMEHEELTVFPLAAQLLTHEESFALAAEYDREKRVEIHS